MELSGNTFEDSSNSSEQAVEKLENFQENAIEEPRSEQELEQDYLDASTELADVQTLKQGYVDRVGKVRDLLGVKPSQDGDNIIAERIEEFEGVEQFSQQRLDDIEDTMLGEPSEEYSKEQQEDVAHTGEIREQQILTPEQRLEQVNQEIEESIAGGMEFFKDIFSQSANKKLAESLFKLKIFNNLWKRGQEYIKNGGEINMSFSISLKYLENNRPSTTNERYWVNSIVFQFKDDGEKFFDDNHADKRELYGQDNYVPLENELQENPDIVQRDTQQP